MSEYSKEFVKDIARRTNENLKNYHGTYDVTQLINSAIGLLIIPHEKYYARIDNSFISSQMLSDMRKSIRQNTYPEEADNIELRDMVKHLRNGIAHSRIYFNSNNGKLCDIQILDHRKSYTRMDKKTGKNTVIPAADFEIVLSVTILRQFMVEFSEAIISKDIERKRR